MGENLLIPMTIDKTPGYPRCVFDSTAFNICHSWLFPCPVTVSTVTHSFLVLLQEAQLGLGSGRATPIGPPWTIPGRDEQLFGRSLRPNRAAIGYRLLPQRP